MQKQLVCNSHMYGAMRDLKQSAYILHGISNRGRRMEQSLTREGKIIELMEMLNQNNIQDKADHLLSV